MIGLLLRTSGSWSLGLAVPLALAGLASGVVACADSAPEPDGTTASLYVMSSIAYAEVTATYVSLLDSLDVAEVDFDQAREFPGQADIWVHEGAVYVTDLDSVTITKFTVENGALVKGAKLSLANYGLTDVGFYLNSFVAPDKAYFMNAGAEYVIWNPETMELTGTIPIPDLPAPAGLKPFASYSDRSALLRAGKLYHPVYYTDDTYFSYAPTSSILVVDVARDEVVDVLEAPCPGLDFATQDDAGNFYFSSWVFAPGGAAVLDQPSTCVVELPADENTPEKLFDFPDLTEGRQGGGMRYLGDGKALLSVLHDERSTSNDVAEVTYGANWQFWLYDLQQGSAEPVDSIPFNAGAAYDAYVDGKPHVLVPAGDYASTQLFELHSDGSARARVKTLGWALRTFQLN